MHFAKNVCLANFHIANNFALSAYKQLISLQLTVHGAIDHSTTRYDKFTGNCDAFANDNGSGFVVGAVVHVGVLNLGSFVGINSKRSRKFTGNN